jgi:hypothetical protein
MLGALHGLAASALQPLLKGSQCLSWLKEKMQRHGSSTAIGEARTAQDTGDKVGDILPLVTKVPCLTNCLLPICNHLCLL